MAKYDMKGREIPDLTPVALPLGYSRPEPLQNMISRMVNNELSKVASMKGLETFEEAGDFDVDEESDPLESSQYELKEMQEEYVKPKPEPVQRGKEGPDRDPDSPEGVKKQEPKEERDVRAQKVSAEIKRQIAGRRATDAVAQ